MLADEVELRQELRQGVGVVSERTKCDDKANKHRHEDRHDVYVELGHELGQVVKDEIETSNKRFERIDKRQETIEVANTK